MTLPPLTISPEANDLKNSFCFPFKGFSVLGNYLHCTWETLSSLLMKIHLTLQQIMALNPLKSDLKSQHRLIELVEYLGSFDQDWTNNKGQVRNTNSAFTPFEIKHISELEASFPESMFNSQI